MKNRYSTIDGFKELTKQQMFDMSAKHVLANGRPSVNSTTLSCVYSGIGCAAAPFLRPEERAKIDNGNDETDWLSLNRNDIVPSHEVVFVYGLQCCHDVNYKKPNAEFVSSFKAQMRNLASSENLDDSILD